jgi:hypothetical protein
MWLRCSIVLAVVVGAACGNDGSWFGAPYDSDPNPRCRLDPDDLEMPALRAVRDREWEDPNDDGRPTCRMPRNPPPRVDAEPPPGLPMTGPITGSPPGLDTLGASDADAGASDLADDGADAGRDGDGDSDGQAV